MSTQMTQQDVQSFAKLAVCRPAAAVNELRAEAPAVRENLIGALRIYPPALLGLLRADNLPRDWKPVIEEELAHAGFKMMT